jgi:signal transduction histidine kinase
VIQGNDQGQHFELLETVSTIGRDFNNHIRLQDAKISRCHAHVLCTDGHFHLIDNNSTNGIYLNGKRKKNCILNHGDRIQLGCTRLLFTQNETSRSRNNEPPDCSQPSTHWTIDQWTMETFGIVDEAQHKPIHKSKPKTTKPFNPAKENEIPSLSATASPIPTFSVLAKSDVLDEVSRPHQPVPYQSVSYQPVSYQPVLSYTKKDNLPADISAIVANLDRLHHTLSATSQTKEIEPLLQQLLEQIAEWITIDRGCIFLYDSELQQLVPQTQRSFANNNKSGSHQHESGLEASWAVNQLVIEEVLKRQEGILTTEKWANNSSNPTKSSNQMIREILCVPMLGCYGLVGVIYLNTCPRSVSEQTVAAHNLTQDHLRLINMVAQQTALALENRQLYQKMIQAEHLATIGQTVSTLSHHIKNILQGIAGGSYLIRTGISNNNDMSLIQRGWNIVEKNQKRISQLILDILTLSKEREPDYELGDIAETVADAVELLRFRAKEDQVEITFQADTTIPKFLFDAEQIHRAITNLVANGIDAAKAKIEQTVPPNRTESRGSETDSKNKMHGNISDRSNHLDDLDNRNDLAKKQLLGLLQVRVDYDQEQSIVLIRVDDNGFGIPETQYHELFHAFYSQKKGQGTGLGLSVARKIIQEHGGKIRVTDSPLGGAKFEIELPTNSNTKK